MSSHLTARDVWTWYVLYAIAGFVSGVCVGLLMGGAS